MILRVLWSRPAELSELSIRRTVPTTGGIYVVWPAWPEPTSRAAIYAGSAHDLQRRMLDHVSGAYGRGALPSFDEVSAIFQIAPLDDPALRKAVVGYLQQHLQPSANRRRPSGEMRPVNLPTDPWNLATYAR